MSSSEFPLGVPVNRPPPTYPQPIAGRPGWYRDANGREFYFETHIAQHPVVPPPRKKP